MVELQKHNEKFQKANIQLVGVSYDSTDILARLSEKMKISFPLLSDKQSKTIKAYGLLNKNAKGRQAGIAHAGTVVIDPKGVVRAKLFVGEYQRHTPQQLLDAIKNLQES